MRAVCAEAIEAGADGFVGGVARQHFVSDGKALGRDNVGDDDLDAVAALVAGAAKAADVRGIFGWLRHRRQAAIRANHNEFSPVW